MLVLVLLALSAASCTRYHLRVIPGCADGLPPEIFTDPRCPPDGFCGYSCLPDRWKGIL